jgi:hypothetical protein
MSVGSNKLWKFVEVSMGLLFVASILFLTVFVCGGLLNAFGRWAWGY